jgi:hypothetical protein
MQTNNAEQITEQSNTAVVADTTSATNTNAIEAGNTATGAEAKVEASGVEGKEQSTTQSDLYYEIDGEEVSASTVAEWRKGHMLQSDYTKKSQANAEMRKSLEAKAKEIESVKTKLSDYVAELESVIKKDSNPEELAELRDTDPSEYLRRKEELAEKQKMSEKAKKELADLKDKEFKSRTAEEAKKLLEALPDWQDPVKLKTDQALIDDYLSANQFSDDDVNSLVSHKLMIMARDAALYNKLKKDSGDIEKQVQKAPNVVKAKVRDIGKTQTREERFYGKK